MSEFLNHEGCPRCGSRDNLAVYDDGHKWCFGCQLYIPPTQSLNLDYLQEKVTYKEKQYDNFNPELPEDCDVGIPKEPMMWLNSYGITIKQQLDNHIQWSRKERMLIFPYYGHQGELLFWQGRYFPKQKPKVFSCGFPHKNLIIIKSNIENSTVVCVEDPVSAIKVSKYCDAVPLFGSNIPLDLMKRLSRYYDKLIIWLDFDKLRTSMKLKETAAIFFKDVKVIATEKDPKEVGYEKIKELINAQERV